MHASRIEKNELNDIRDAYLLSFPIRVGCLVLPFLDVNIVIKIAKDRFVASGKLLNNTVA